MVDAAKVVREVGKRVHIVGELWLHRRSVSFSYALVLLRRGRLPRLIAGGDAEANPGTGGVVFRGSTIALKEHPHSKAEFAGTNGTDAEAVQVADKTGNRFPVKGGSLEASAIVGPATPFIPSSGVAAAAISGSVLVRRVRLRSDPDNLQTIPLWINAPGSSTSTGYPLFPGDPLVLDVVNVNLIGASCPGSGQKLHWIGEV